MAEKKDAKKQVVLGPLVAIKTDDGRRVQMYRGAVVGEGFDKGDVERLKDMGLVGDEADDVVPGVAVLPS